MKTTQEIKKDMKEKFVFAFFEESKGFLQDEGIEVANIARLVLLSTYLNYDGCLMLTQRKPMSKSELREITKCTRYSTWINFWETTTKSKILLPSLDGTISISQKYFKKGSVKDKQNNDISHIRLYTDQIQNIFDNCNSRDIISLGRYFSLIPFINFRYNVISHNPSESYERKIVPMCIEEVSKSIHMSLRGFEKTIVSLSTIKTKDNTPILGIFKAFGDKRKNKMIVNPYVMYRGNWSERDIEVIMEICEQLEQK